MIYILFRKYVIVFTCDLFAGCDNNKNNIIVIISEGVINVNGTTATWEVPVNTDRTEPANRPYTEGLLHDKKEKTCLLIDIAIPEDSNVNTKGTEELSKYKDPKIEDSGMWKVRTNTASVIIGALGTIRKGLDQNLQLLPGHPSAKEL
jgi:hypothetical protein